MNCAAGACLLLEIELPAMSYLGIMSKLAKSGPKSWTFEESTARQQPALIRSFLAPAS
jgi:hypothetical protein